jgi:hypothetical protein
VRVTREVYNDIQKEAKKKNLSVSSWLNRIVTDNLYKQYVMPKELKPPAETRLTTTKKTYGPNTPLLYKNVPMILKDLAMRLSVSFIYLHNRLKQGDSLESIVRDCEDRQVNRGN